MEEIESERKSCPPQTVVNSQNVMSPPSPRVTSFFWVAAQERSMERDWIVSITYTHKQRARERSSYWTIDCIGNQLRLLQTRN